MAGADSKAVAGRRATVARKEAPDDDAYELVIGIAAGQMDLRHIASTLARWH